MNQNDHPYGSADDSNEYGEIYGAMTPSGRNNDEDKQVTVTEAAQGEPRTDLLA